MQTLKTAAIVVLLLTVMYGAFVSLTTPPEPLPAEVVGLVIDEDGSLAIDAGLPESLGALEINAGTPTDEPNGPSGPIGIAGLESSGEIAGQPADLSATNPVPSGQTIDAASSLQVSSGSSQDSGVTTRLTDLASTPPAAVEAASPDAMGSMVPSYPTTNSTFEIPDPNSIVSNFDASPEGVDLPQTDLALASGTSDSVVPNVPPVEQPTKTPNAGASSGTNLGLANAIRIADRQYADDERSDALATLSIFYNTPDLSGEQRAELLTRLDPLAREVIYSKRHLLEQPHRVGQNETLMQVATKYEVPWQLLANINQIQDPLTVLPGTELKIVRGPFRAEVNLSLKELTLFMGDLYAGRFPIGVGDDPIPKPGTFTVQDKQTARTYYGASGAPVPPGNPANPYGEVWLDLGGQLSIHGSPSPTRPTEKGCISLAADYADDLYGILSQGSSVTIRR